jgi:PAS domain S-box-containing protein
MPVENTDELIRSLDALPVPAILTELHTRTFVAANSPAEELFGTKTGELVGDDVLTHIHPIDRNAARTAYAAMAAKAIDGYQVQRRIVRPDASEVAVNISGRRIDDPVNPLGLWVLNPASEPPTSFEVFMMKASGVVLAVTDHDWQIEYMSSDAELLGAQGSELRGFPLLGLVHPSAAQQFLAAAAQTAADHLAITLLTRMRAGIGRWEDRYCLLVPICEHRPPRLGVIISAGPSEASTGPSGMPLDEHARHATLEMQSMKSLDTLPALTRLPQGSELSARQTEIVARLVAGQRPADVARSLFLSPSTVRNHLAAVYRKFGVHSEAELLATLLRSASSDHDL